MSNKISNADYIPSATPFKCFGLFGDNSKISKCTVYDFGLFEDNSKILKCILYDHNARLETFRVTLQHDTNQNILLIEIARGIYRTP